MDERSPGEQAHNNKTKGRFNLMLWITLAWCLFLGVLAAILWVQPDWAFHINVNIN